MESWDVDPGLKFVLKDRTSYFHTYAKPGNPIGACDKQPIAGKGYDTSQKDWNNNRSKVWTKLGLLYKAYHLQHPGVDYFHGSRNPDLSS